MNSDRGVGELSPAPREGRSGKLRGQGLDDRGIYLICTYMRQ